MKLHPCQAGFRRGYSTYTQILTSDEWSRRGRPISVFLDLKAAYDTVPWYILEEKLIERQIDPCSLGLIKNLMLRPASLHLVTNHFCDPKAIFTSRGLFQGAILSPILFAIFIV